jgi:mannose-6-phosphate isomerase-like protein (cupin superfamily)
MIMTSKTTGIVLGALLAGAAAQAAPADHYTVADLTKAMVKLKAEAATTGSASEKLQQYPGHFTMLAYRNRDGGGELHQQFADIFYIVKGKATLLTEGTLVGAKEESQGELRGTAVEGGKKTALAAGDVVHIPAGTPHQLLVPKGHELLYFVIKVKEN